MPDKVDPQKAEKQWTIVKAVVEAPSDAVILYGDESRIQLLPLVRAMWHWVGQQLRIPTPGSNVTRTLFGALNIRTGQWIHLVRQRMRKEDFGFSGAFAGRPSSYPDHSDRGQLQQPYGTCG